MYCVIHARKVVLMIVPFLIGIISGRAHGTDYM